MKTLQANDSTSSGARAVRMHNVWHLSGKTCCKSLFKKKKKAYTVTAEEYLNDVIIQLIHILKKKKKVMQILQKHYTTVK